MIGKTTTQNWFKIIEYLDRKRETMITLPRDAFGYSLMLALIALIIIVPFVIVFWAMSIIAPWWVALPCGLLASLVAFLVLVKFKS